MDVFTSTITGGVFGVIIYFLACNGEEKTISQINARIAPLLSACSNGNLFRIYQHSYVIVFCTNTESP